MEFRKIGWQSDLHGKINLTIWLCTDEQCKNIALNVLKIAVEVLWGAGGQS